MRYPIHVILVPQSQNFSPFRSAMTCLQNKRLFCFSICYIDELEIAGKNLKCRQNCEKSQNFKSPKRTILQKIQEKFGIIRRQFKELWSFSFLLGKRRNILKNRFSKFRTFFCENHSDKTNRYLKVGLWYGGGAKFNIFTNKWFHVTETGKFLLLKLQNVFCFIIQQTTDEIQFHEPYGHIQAELMCDFVFTCFALVISYYIIMWSMSHITLGFTCLSVIE